MRVEGKVVNCVSVSVGDQLKSARAVTNEWLVFERLNGLGPV